MTASWNNPKLTNSIQSDVPDLQTLLAAALKQDPTGTDDIPNGAKRLVSTAQGYELQVYNGTVWSSVGKLSHDVQTVDGYSAATGTTASTIPVRTSAGKLEGDITGNAATATTAVTLSSTLGVGLGGTGATTAETARSNLGVPPTDHASSTTSYGIGTSTAYGHVKLTDDTTSQSGAAGGIAATPLLVDTVDSTCLHLTGAETASGVKTFSDGIAANVTGNLTGNASGSASTLATARALTTNLESLSSASFDGSADVSIGVSGVLPVANGGTGATSLSNVTVGNATVAASCTGNSATATTATNANALVGAAATATPDWQPINTIRKYEGTGYGNLPESGYAAGASCLFGQTNGRSSGNDWTRGFWLYGKWNGGNGLWHGQRATTTSGTITWKKLAYESDAVMPTATGSNYVRYSNGLQLCWECYDAATGDRTITFPVPFSSLPGVALSHGSCFVGDWGTTGFTIRTGGGSYYCAWVAIGRWA